jgi:hypothetical protein
MIGQSVLHRGRGALILASALCVLAMLISPVGVTAQTAPPGGQFVQPSQPQAQPAPASPATPSPQRSPGFLESIGRWMDESRANMNKSLDDMWQGAARNSSEAAKASNEATSNLAKGAVDAAKDTADALGKLGTGRIATGRARCVTAANGAPDCRLAAEQLCKSKGFSTGNSLENETVERCSPLVLLRGNKKPGECPIEHTVTKAMCQ